MRLEMGASGAAMYELVVRLFPICRSLTGDGVRETLAILKEHVPLKILEIPSGIEVFDWEVPDEWNIRDAYVADENDTRLIDFRKNNLHVLGYSIPFEGTLSLAELKPHLFSIPDQPDAIPYLTSYYERRWGFCLSHRQLEELPDQRYKVKIDTTLEPGVMTYGELVLPGETDKEVLLSTYICHPSMANDNLSGVVTTMFLAAWLAKKTRRRYTYRILFVPETIGTIAYLSCHKDEMVRNTVAGYVVTCVGHSGPFTYIRSRRENTLSDRAAEHVLTYAGDNYEVLDYTYRQSDERQYCSPGIDLPVGSLMRTKYGSFPEYHTSLDNLDFVTAEALEGSFRMYAECLEVIEANGRFQVQVADGEPNLGKRGLYPTLGSQKGTTSVTEDLMALLAYCDGKHDLIDIAEKHRKPVRAYFKEVAALTHHKLIRAVD